MSDTNGAGSSFVGYEYKEITVPRDMEAAHTDGYVNFGWTLVGGDTLSASHGTNTVSLKFKRDRKIRNKAELTRLQRQFEACVGEIASLEKSKTGIASIAAFSVGVIGSAFLAGSVFAYIGGMLVFSVVLAVPGFLGWIIPYFAYCKIKKEKAVRLAPVIDQKYDEIYAACEKASGLLDG